jgi:hypothetical protein
VAKANLVSERIWVSETYTACATAARAVRCTNARERTRRFPAELVPHRPREGRQRRDGAATRRDWPKWSTAQESVGYGSERLLHIAVSARCAVRCRINMCNREAASICCASFFVDICVAVDVQLSLLYARAKLPTSFTAARLLCMLAYACPRHCNNSALLSYELVSCRTFTHTPYWRRWLRILDYTLKTGGGMVANLCASTERLTRR